jgi:hypothetical protein
VSQLSATNTIEPRSIAEYLGNQLERSSTLDKVMKVAMRLNSLPQNEEYVDSLLLKLKTHLQTNGGSLSGSFAKEDVKKFYLKLRS